MLQRIIVTLSYLLLSVLYCFQIFTETKTKEVPFTIKWTAHRVGAVMASLFAVHASDVLSINWSMNAFQNAVVLLSILGASSVYSIIHASISLSRSINNYSPPAHAAVFSHCLLILNVALLVLSNSPILLPSLQDSFSLAFWFMLQVTLVFDISALWVQTIPLLKNLRTFLASFPQMPHQKNPTSKVVVKVEILRVAATLLGLVSSIRLWVVALLGGGGISAGGGDDGVLALFHEPRAVHVVMWLWVALFLWFSWAPLSDGSQRSLLPCGGGMCCGKGKDRRE